MSAAAAVRAALAADVPVLLWGPPGTGKTAALTALAAEEGAHLESLLGATLDPAEVGGTPYPHGGELLRAPPDWALRLRTALARGPAWLMLDELSCARPDVQAALLRVVHERRVGALDLRGCRVVAAANPADSAADGGWLSPAMAGRWAHLQWEVSQQAWIAGELGGWGTPGTPQHQAARAVICAWIQRSPSALAPPIPTDAADLRGHPSPRSWSALARCMAEAPITTPPGAALATALVGAPAAGELITWAAALDLPDPEAVIGGAPLPRRGDQITATLSAVVALAIASGRIEAAWRVVGRARADAQVIPGQALLAAAPECVPAEALALAARLGSV